MKCPICHKPVRLQDREAPFCSDRCRLLDLGNWASGTYVIPGPPVHMPGEMPGDDDD